MSRDGRRFTVAGDSTGAGGSVPWAFGLHAHSLYAERTALSHSAERVHERGGFSRSELTSLGFGADEVEHAMGLTLTLRHCRTCGFWTRPAGVYEGHGECRAIHPGTTEHAPALVWLQGADASLRTRPDFGCSVHQPWTEAASGGDSGSPEAYKKPDS